jgi:hypothetical protein
MNKATLYDMDQTTTQKWYTCELRLLKEFNEKLKLDVEIMQDMVFQLNDMRRAVDHDCSVIEMTILQAKRDRALKKYLDEYNKHHSTPRDHTPSEGYDELDI